MSSFDRGAIRRRRPRVRRVGNRVIAEHRLVWEARHGPIPEGMVIHHVNGDNQDNRIENLQLVTRAEHRHIHAGYECRDGVWYKQCRTCKKKKPLTEFYRYPYYPYDGAIPYCKPCHNKACRERQRKVRARRRQQHTARSTTQTPGDL